AGIGVWPKDSDPVLQNDSQNLQADLAAIGYARDVATEKTVTAFQRRWVQDAVTGKADPMTRSMIGLVKAAILK
ncbi:MAG: hypothetical protein L3J02_05220, partial [Henriciella sp.]|nr:hypothetical protein [Henriciella sp.]